MLAELKHSLGLGLAPNELTLVQVSLRAVIVFVVSLVIVRVANKRFLASLTAFDALLGFILASMLARAVNGSVAFFPTLGGAFVLVALHWLMAKLAFRSDKFGNLVKGRERRIVTGGKLDWEAMAEASISEKDLLEEARLNGSVSRVEDIAEATLERDGEISIIPKKR